MIFRFFLLSFLTLFFACERSEWDRLPVLEKGRYRPLIATTESIAHLGEAEGNRDYAALVSLLKERQVPLDEIPQKLEEVIPLSTRIQQAGNGFHMLPRRHKVNQWAPLASLSLVVYDPKTDALLPVTNFTAYPDPLFRSIQSAYLAWLQDKNNPLALHNLASTLREGYTFFAGKPAVKTPTKTLYFPTLLQLWAEYSYAIFPFSLIALICYFGALYFPRLAAVGFLIQTIAIALRCYILLRPPVSNMFETLLFVPWIVMLSAFVINRFFSFRLFIPVAAFISGTLLGIQRVTQGDDVMENVQAVLDSQYWLTIHVLLVVASYGLFVLSGVLGHFYLAFDRWKRSRVNEMGQLIAVTMMIGTGLLICGTILGGVWAAQSWGRFWDWDPKESWAFISCCVYLVFIHLYRFKKIAYRGLAIGSILGLHAIVFTWYGVNYLLGSGLHSYGFGAGGQEVYFLFLVADALFMVAALKNISGREASSADST